MLCKLCAPRTACAYACAKTRGLIVWLLDLGQRARRLQLPRRRLCQRFFGARLHKMMNKQVCLPVRRGSAGVGWWGRTCESTHCGGVVICTCLPKAFGFGLSCRFHDHV